MDLNKLISPEHGAVAYAYREFEFDRELPVDIRIGTANGFKLWVNGELLFAHEEYHQSMRIDQYRAQAQLRPGTNRLLLKICQNEQTEDWAHAGDFNCAFAIRPAPQSYHLTIETGPSTGEATRSHEKAQKKVAKIEDHLEAPIDRAC